MGYFLRYSLGTVTPLHVQRLHKLEAAQTFEPISNSCNRTYFDLCGVGALSSFTFHRSAVRYSRNPRLSLIGSCVSRWNASIARPVFTVASHQASGLDTDMAALDHPTSWDDFSMPAGIEEAAFMSNHAKPASPSSTTSSAGTKRKRATDPKFYAVRVGYHPGIYHSWSDCLAEVTGFKNATCEFGLRSILFTANLSSGLQSSHSLLLPMPNHSWMGIILSTIKAYRLPSLTNSTLYKVVVYRGSILIGLQHRSRLLDGKSPSTSALPVRQKPRNSYGTASGTRSPRVKQILAVYLQR